MSGHQFDTSGRVRRGVITPRNKFVFRPGFLRWPDLKPFEQEYVEAMFYEFHRLRELEMPNNASLGFLHLAPETLARIRADCVRIQNADPHGWQTKTGEQFYKRRQAGDYRDFPPLTIGLNKAGKVVFL